MPQKSVRVLPGPSGYRDVVYRDAKGHTHSAKIVGRASTSTDEQQTVTVSGASAGTFTLTYAGQTTAAIAYNATAAAVQTALRALSNIAPDGVSCSGGPLNTSAVTVTFQNALGGRNVAQMTADNTNMTGGTAVVATTVAGVDGGVKVKLTHYKTGRVIDNVPLATARTDTAKYFHRRILSGGT